MMMLKTKPQTPVSPILRCYTMDDVTLEKALEICAENTGGVMFLKDELSGWFGSMDAYRPSGKNKDRSVYIEAYNGGRRTVDRMSRHTSVENWSLSIYGTIQPEPLWKLFNKSEDDGLLQRFLIIYGGGCRVWKRHPSGREDTGPL